MDSKLLTDIEITLKYLYHAPTEYVTNNKANIIEYMKRVKLYIEKNIDKSKELGKLYNKVNNKLKNKDRF